jgi:hypothetical protein
LIISSAVADDEVVLAVVSLGMGCILSPAQLSGYSYSTLMRFRLVLKFVTKRNNAVNFFTLAARGW